MKISSIIDAICREGIQIHCIVETKLTRYFFSREMFVNIKNIAYLCVGKRKKTSWKQEKSVSQSSKLCL